MRKSNEQWKNRLPVSEVRFWIQHQYILHLLTSISSSEVRRPVPLQKLQGADHGSMDTLLVNIVSFIPFFEVTFTFYRTASSLMTTRSSYAFAIDPYCIYHAPLHLFLYILVLPPIPSIFYLRNFRPNAFFSPTIMFAFGSPMSSPVTLMLSFAHV